MPKTVTEIQVKFYLCFLDAVLDQNYVLETIEVEDNVWPESLVCENLSGTFRLKSFLRSDSFKHIEKVYLKIS